MTVLVLIALLGANPEPRSEMDESASTAGSPGEARFREGIAAYDAREYQRAIEAFEDAYRASGKPEILFNLAQTYRVLGDCRRAIESLDAFVAAVPADNPLVVRARARRSELGSCDDVVTPIGAPSRPATEASPPPALPAEPRSLNRGARTEGVLVGKGGLLPPRSPSRAASILRNACSGSIGAMVAFAGAGTGLGLWARSLQSSVEGAEVWNETTTRDDERGRSLGQAATTLFVAAGVATAVAATTCLLGWTRDR